ncbi:MAG: FIST C-terminal domain-containing protein [Candidatus Omnitrophica bacterium]|nr:FIST C-terminal domain-containing protein [Candidatus Omnitrophota bacterium]
MAHSAGIGFSQQPDTIVATQEAIDEAKERFNSNHIDIVLFFHTVHYDAKTISSALYTDSDRAQVIGSSTAGIILPDRVETRGIAVLIIGSDYIRFQSHCASHLKLQNLAAAGKTLAEKASLETPPSQRKLFLLLVDGLISDISSLIAGAKTFLGPSFPVIGSGSSDNFRFQKTYQSFNNKALTDSATGVLMTGEFKYGGACRHGCRPLGKPRKITKTTGNIINQIDKKNAFHIFEEYFEGDADQIRQGILGYINLRYPLGIYSAAKQEYLLRNVLDILDDDSIVCQDTVLKDKEIHIMSGNVDTYLQAAVEAAKSVKTQLEGKEPSLILIFESLTRYKLLGKAIHQETQLIQQVLGKNSPLLGMYSFGEIFTSYMAENFGQTQLQNGSILIFALS